MQTCSQSGRGRSGGGGKDVAPLCFPRQASFHKRHQSKVCIPQRCSVLPTPAPHMADTASLQTTDEAEDLGQVHGVVEQETLQWT